MSEILLLAAPFILSMVITVILTPCWITVCRKWHLFDKPDNRKHHIITTPSMGGLAIFAGIFISFLMFAGQYEFFKLKFILGAAVLLFFTGFFDDLLNINPQKKLVIQIIAGIIIISGGTRITSLYGILGIYEIPLVLQYLVTLLVIVFFTNAFNFIDGIDSLAAMLGVICSAIFGYMFFKYGQADFALLCFCLTGALFGFLFYNFHPAKIFMGDTGSLVIGFLLISFAINLLGINYDGKEHAQWISPSFIIAVLFIPIYDILRVSVIRILNGTSPLSPDRNHIHHMILKQGFGHTGATLILAAFNIFFICIEFILNALNVNGFILLSICLAMLMINSIVMLQIAGIRNKLLGEPKKKLEITKM